jgi:hypothetical protein
MKRNGFKALLPGIESWYDMGDKSRTGRITGMDKVRQVSDHINMILRNVPYVQTNFVLGLDGDKGSDRSTHEVCRYDPGRISDTPYCPRSDRRPR